MCGIIAGIHDNIFLVLLAGLVQLQNRGYDSAGISLYNNESKSFEVFKKASTEKKGALTFLEEYSEKVNEFKINKYIGIGHTRWATHGAKTDKNAHPHVSNNGEFSLVHNGIIENFKELKTLLIESGYVMYSETDTEIIVNLIEMKYRILKDVKEAIREAINMLKGTWGLQLQVSIRLIFFIVIFLEVQYW